MSEASPARGQSPVGQRNPAASMSRRDRSPVGNVGGAGSREPLQGLDGVCRRVSHVSARIWAQEFCGILREQRAICEGGGHRILMKQKDDKILRIICKY